MAVRGNVVTWQLASGEDLSDLAAGTGNIWKPLTLDGTVAQKGEHVVGILQDGGRVSGDHVTVAISGVSKFTAGGAVTNGDYLTVENSGYITTAASGDTVVGQALYSCTSGSVGTGHFNFATRPSFDVTSAGGLVPFTTQVDMSSGFVGHAVDFTGGDFAATATVADGVLVIGADSGDTAYAGVIGPLSLKTFTGSSTTQGQSVTVTSGYFRNAEATDLIFGRSAVAITGGNAGLGYVNFATPHYATTSLDVMF